MYFSHLKMGAKDLGIGVAATSIDQLQLGMSVCACFNCTTARISPITP